MSLVEEVAVVHGHRVKEEMKLCPSSFSLVILDVIFLVHQNVCVPTSQISLTFRF